MGERKPDQEAKGMARRDFLRTASVGAVAGIGAAIVGDVDDATAEAPALATKSRYRETDHVRQAYDLSRF